MKVTVDIGKALLAYEAKEGAIEVGDLVIVPVRDFASNGSRSVVGRVDRLGTDYDGFCYSIIKKVADLKVGDGL